MSRNSRGTGAGMRLGDFEKRHSRKFAEWLSNQMAGIPARAALWNQFIEFTKLADAEAREAIALNNRAPLILLGDLDGLVGKFEPGQEVIVIDQALAESATDGQGSAADLEALEATILHEIVHWARDKAGLPQTESVGGEVVEVGIAFEQAAYGQAKKGCEACTISNIKKEQDGAASTLPANPGYVPEPFDGSNDNRSIGFRNNNPLNLRPGGGAWQGMTGTMHHERAGDFVTFATVEHGLRAAAITLINYKLIHGADTLHSIIHRWAPVADNNHTEYYIRAVEQETSIARNRPLDFLRDPEVLVRVLIAMAHVENGANPLPYRQATFEQGARLALARFGF